MLSKRIKIPHQCYDCNKDYEHIVNWIDPKSFSDPENAIMKQTFWCPLCSKPQAVHIKLLSDEKAEITEKLNYRDLVNEDSFSFYSSDKDPDDDDQVENDDYDFFHKIEELASISFKADTEK